MWGAVSVATQWTKVRRMRRVSAKRIAQLLVIAIPSVVFFALPAAVVTVWLALFWLLEGIAFLALKPFSRKRVNPPRFTWRTS